jgi:hypothetical protein
MSSLGYKVLHTKETKRMAYWLLNLDRDPKEEKWRKKVINEGGGRNNFSIVNV